MSAALSYASQLCATLPQPALSIPDRMRRAADRLLAPDADRNDVIAAAAVLRIAAEHIEQRGRYVAQLEDRLFEDAPARDHGQYLGPEECEVEGDDPRQP